MEKPLLPIVSKDSCDQRTRGLLEGSVSDKVLAEIELFKQENPNLFNIAQNYADGLPLMFLVRPELTRLLLIQALTDIYMSLRSQAEADRMEEEINLG